MAITAAEFKAEINDLAQSDQDTPSARLIALIDGSEDLLFQGKDEIQPIKIYQIGRIYRLAKTCIEIITLLWPYLRTIITLLKKIF